MPERFIPENLVFRYPEGSSNKRKKAIREEALYDLHEDLDVKDMPELERELPKEEWQEQITAKVNRSIIQYLKEEMGLKLDEVSLDKIHILNKYDLADALNVLPNTIKGGERKGNIFLSSEISESPQPKLEFTKILTHEVLHSRIFLKIAEILVRSGNQEVRVVAPERQGVKVLKRNKYPIEHRFSGIDEGVTELLSKKIFHNLVSNDPDYQQEINQRFSKLDEKIERQEVFRVFGDGAYDVEDVKITKLEGDRADYVWTEKGTYLAEQDLIRFVASGITKKSPQKYQSPDEALYLFFKAQYKGELLPLVKEIDETFGRGTARLLASIEPWREEGTNPQAKNALQFLRLPPGKRDPELAMRYIFGGNTEDFQTWLSKIQTPSRQIKRPPKNR